MNWTTFRYKFAKIIQMSERSYTDIRKNYTGPTGSQSGSGSTTVEFCHWSFKDWLQQKIWIILCLCTLRNRKQRFILNNTVVCSCTLPKALAGRKAAFSDENDLGPLPHPLVLYLCDLRNKALIRFVPVRVVPEKLLPHSLRSEQSVSSFGWPGFESLMWHTCTGMYCISCVKILLGYKAPESLN